MPKNLYKDLVIYDLDGTLVDSAITVTTVLNILRQKQSKSLLSAEFVRPVTSLGGHELIRQALECADQEVDVYLNEFRRLYAETDIGSDTLFPEVSETLGRLKMAGCRLAICTNKPRDLAEKTLAAVELLDQFDFLLCYDEAARNKPAPDPVIKILKNLDCSPDRACFIGDSEADLLAARGSDVAFIFYDSGYDCRMTTRKGLNLVKSHLPSLRYILK